MTVLAAGQAAEPDRVSVSVFPRIVLWHPGRGGAVRVTVRWPRERDGLVGRLYYQLAYPGESGMAFRELDGAPRQFVRYFDRMPPGVSEFIAETCKRVTDDCEQARVTVEVK